MKSILVPIGGSETDEALFETALTGHEGIVDVRKTAALRVSAGQAAVNTPHTEFAMGPALSSALVELDRCCEATAECRLTHSAN